VINETATANDQSLGPCHLRCVNAGIPRPATAILPRFHGC
jgi:hypothetical protein